MGSLRVGQDSATSLSLFTFMHWRRKWQPTPVFWEGGAEAERSEGREVEKAGERAAEEGEALRGGDWRRRGGRDDGDGGGEPESP